MKARELELELYTMHYIGLCWYQHLTHQIKTPLYLALRYHVRSNFSVYLSSMKPTYYLFMNKNIMRFQQYPPNAEYGNQKCSGTKVNIIDFTGTHQSQLIRTRCTCSLEN